MLAAAFLPIALVGASLDATIERFRSDNRIVGMTVAVYKDGRLAYEKAFGYRDLAKGERSRTTDLYRLASVSKPITAVGAMLLVEKGALNLEANIRPSIPEMPQEGPSITLRGLLSHTGGIRHYQGAFDKTSVVLDHFPTAAEAVKLFANDPLIAEPRTKYSYSTHAFTLAARLIEGASGEPFPAYMRKAVFSKTRDLDCEFLSQEKPARTQLYGLSKDDKPVAATKREDNSWKFAGGGMESTAKGLAWFGVKLMDGKILKKSTLSVMWKPTTLTDGSKTTYGLGFGVAKNGDVMHGGAQQGARSAFYLSPSRRICVAILTNTSGAFNPMDLAKDLADASYPFTEGSWRREDGAQVPTAR